MKTVVALMSFGLLLSACSGSEPQSASTAAPPAAAPAEAPAPAPARPAVAAAKAPAECATLRNPHAGKLEPLQAVTQAGPVTFQVEIADTDAEREYGLMCRTEVAADRGMLFEFDSAKNQAFWMHNTLAPLDIIYIGADGQVVSIARNARPLDESPIPSGAPAKGVLELAGGRAAEIGLLPGDKIVHPFFKP